MSTTIHVTSDIIVITNVNPNSAHNCIESIVLKDGKATHTITQHFDCKEEFTSCMRGRDGEYEVTATPDQLETEIYDLCDGKSQALRQDDVEELLRRVGRFLWFEISEIEPI